VLAVVSNREDLTADWLILELKRRSANFVRLNSEDYALRTKLRWTLDDAVLTGPHGTLSAAEVTAVWWRRPLRPSTGDDRDPAEAAWAAKEAQVALDGFWAMTAAHWVNLPVCNAAADCKPEQLLRARRVGFRVPATLLTGDASEVRDFAAEHGGIVTKALADGRVPAPGGGCRLFPTVLLSEQQLADLATLGPEPSLFQALIPKAFDIRVTVIGDRAYACRIGSQSDPTARIDWRRGNVNALVHQAIELPRDVAVCCVNLAASYGLRFAAIDLAETSEGDYVFFELNPNGQWAWVEQLTGQPLAERLADELLGSTA
jgi:glutathione synthase/RimK-type ligase-like ATP-grasp enzyme